MPVRLKEEDVIKSINVVDNYHVVECNYINQKSKIKVMHETCNNTFLIDQTHWSRGQRCPFCNRYSTKFSNNEFIEKLETKQPGKFAVLGQYTNKRTKVKVKCNTCGEIFESLPGNLYKGQCMGCMRIAAKNRNTKKVKDIQIPEEYKIVGDYINNKTNVEVLHLNCNNTFFVTTTNLRGGSRCPYCYSTSSLEQEALKNELSKELNGLKFESIKEYINKKEHKYYELDIYNEDKKIGIEFDGLYWHSNKFKDSDYHLSKTRFFEQRDIRVIHIFEDEWKNKKDIVIDKLLSIFGGQKDKIYARECTIKEVLSKDRNIFLEANHIQGADSASISYGLYYNNELVAVMSFSKLRKALGQDSRESVYELSRYAGKLGYTIVGGFSKLFKNILRLHPEIKEVITYADLRWSSAKSNVYLKNGFKLDHVSKPSYFYLDSNYKTRLFRYNYRKQVLKSKFPEIYSDEKTEFQIMDEAGYMRIWDCGNLVYKIKIKR